MTRHTERLLTPAFVGLSIAEVAYFTAFGVAIFTLPLHVTGPIGSTPFGAGLAFGAFAVSALLFRPFAGRLVDVLGRRPLLIAGAVGSGLGMASMTFVDSLSAVIIIRLVQGLAEAGFFVAGFALLADLAPPDRMGEAASYNSLGLYIGIALGPALAEQLMTSETLNRAWYGAAILCACAALIAVFIHEPSRETAEVGRVPLIHRAAIPASLGFFTSLAAVGGFLAFASLRSTELELSSTSVVLLVYGGVIVFCRIAFARVSDRLPPLSVAMWSLVAIGIGLGCTAVVPGALGFVAGVVVCAVGVSFSTPAFFALIFATATPSQRGAASGTASAFMDLGLGLGPIALGAAAEAAGITAAFGVGAGIALLGAGWTLHLARATPRTAPQGSST